jgi:PAS domain-containing protein
MYAGRTHMAKKPTYDELVKKVSDLKKEAVGKRKLLKQLRLHALAFDHIYDGIVLTDFKGHVIDWNPSAERMFGYTKEEMLGKTTGVIHRPEEAAALTDTIL